MDAAAWAKARDLIGDALELPASERDGFVASRCADPALLAEIRSVLKLYEEAPSFLEHPPAPDELDDEPEDLPPGTQIGPYVVVDRLGRGGMGEVFLGNDRRLKRKVALKHLLPSRVGPDHERARILREARAAARINHPNVATIHDVVEHGTGVFIVMEYVEGESLAARLRRDRMPIAQVVSIGRQLASALAAAHAQGVVHRDLKPGNVQLSPDGTVKVLDFGVAKATFPLSSTASTTAAGVVDVPGVQPGTPAYMSPEQMLGREVDARSDIFSLGVVLFEMATGRRPYGNGDPIERIAALNHRAERADAVAPAVPRALADVIAKALEVDVRDRFQRALDIGLALDAVHRETATAAIGGKSEDKPSLGSRILGKALWLLVVIATLFAFGVITSAAFNLSLQRPARFADESVFRYLLLGFQANFVLLIVALALTTVMAAAKFLVRVLSLAPPVERGIQQLQQRLTSVSARLGLDNPTIFGQSLAAFGAIGLIALVWWNLEQIGACLQWVSLAAPERLHALSPAASFPRGVYRISTDLLLLSLGIGAIHLVRLRRRHRTEGSAGTLAIICGLLGIIMLVHIVPYRLMFQSQFERIEVAGVRCYLIDEIDVEAFVFCAEGRPPRSQVIGLDRPDVRRFGVFESIFTPPFQPSGSDRQ